MHRARLRRLSQWAALLASNPMLLNLLDGRLYKGSLKNICAPGLNCWSCPAAVLACPIGALQAVGGSMNFSVSLFALGSILLIGLLIGRSVCGWLCPFGLIQELIFKLPTPKFELPRRLRFGKYFMLIVFVLIAPTVLTNFAGIGEPAFCEFICPVGTLEAGLPMLISRPELRAVIGNLFALKLVVLLIVLIGCVSTERFFCRTLCPLGALYGLLNRISFYRLSLDRSKCIECGQCRRRCPMSIDPTVENNSIECARCEKCSSDCPKQAIEFEVK